MKVIFLDIDGVLCLENQFGTRFNKANFVGMKSDILVRFDDFDIPAIKALNRILKETGAEIVVSSDWRRYATVAELGTYFNYHGIAKLPIGKTIMVSSNMRRFSKVVDHDSERVDEINLYISEHPEIKQWIALDDMDLSALGPNFIRIMSENGLNEKEYIDKAILLLNQ